MKPKNDLQNYRTQKIIAPGQHPWWDLAMCSLLQSFVLLLLGSSQLASLWCVCYHLTPRCAFFCGSIGQNLCYMIKARHCCAGTLKHFFFFFNLWVIWKDSIKTALCVAVWLWSQDATDCLFPCSQVLLLVVKQIFPDFEFMWLVEEAKKNLPLELDFLNEGRNAEKVAHMLKNFDFLKVRKHIFLSIYVH